MILGGAAMDLAFIRRTSPPSLAAIHSSHPHL